MPLLIELLEDELLAPFAELGLLAELRVRNAMMEDVVEIEAMSVQKLDGISLCKL